MLIDISNTIPSRSTTRCEVMAYHDVLATTAESTNTMAITSTDKPARTASPA